MPNSPQARKRLRQDAKRASRNQERRSSMRTFEKKLLAKISEGDKAAAEQLLPEVYQQLDKAAKQRVIHPNTAANHKSRLARLLARM